MTDKFDGLIEAVRYNGDQIQCVRAYERRGATFSDQVLLPRKELVERLKKGRKFVTGRRREFLASTFQVDRPVQIIKQDDREVIATRPGANHDELDGLPVF